MEKNYYVFIALLFILLLPAKGQDPPLEGTSDSSVVVLENIVVSASKMNLKVKEMPASVSIVSAKAIRLNEIGSLHSINTLVPNFAMPEYGSKLTSPVYIRGIGSRINAPSIGLYVDNVPYFDKSTFSLDLFDIEHIEVLRGPQGTLYGRNSMGGMINITTRSPMEKQGGHIGVTLATYGNYRVEGGYYGKINNDAAVSLSARYQHRDGFFTNRYLDEKVDELNSFALRNRLVYKLSREISLENIAGFEWSRQGGYPYAIYNDSLKTLDAVRYNQKSSYDRNMFSDALIFKYAKPTWEISNSLSYQYFDDVQRIDQDFSTDSLYFAKQTQKQKMVSNELSARSKGDGTFKWVLGGFGLLQSFSNLVDVDVYNINQWYVKDYNTNLRGFAFFGQLSVKIQPNLVLTGGIRYDYEQSELEYAYYGQRGINELPAIDTVYPVLKDHVMLPKVALTYKFGNTNIYASYSTGYKPGGFNSTSDLPDSLLRFKHENSHNFEAGIKSSLFENLIYTDFALFFTRMENQQIYRTAPNGRGSYLHNSGLSENTGFEISVRNKEFHGFEAMVAYGYTQSKIIKYVQDAAINFNNHYTPYIPRHTMAVQLTKRVKLKNNQIANEALFNVVFHQSGITYWDLKNNFAEERYQLFDAKIILTRNNIQVDFWGRNLLNTRYKSFLFEANNKVYAQKGRPFQAGVNVTVKF